MKEISKRMLAIITDSKLSYAELEKKTGISKSCIQRYATGKTKKIPIDVVKHIADATNSSPAYLMGWEEKNDADNDIILRFRTDDEFRAIMKSVNNFSPELLNALKAFISIFEK